MADDLAAAFEPFVDAYRNAIVRALNEHVLNGLASVIVDFVGMGDAPSKHIGQHKCGGQLLRAATMIWCTNCNYAVDTKAQLQAHMLGKRHGTAPIYKNTYDKRDFKDRARQSQDAKDESLSLARQAAQAKRDAELATHMGFPYRWLAAIGANPCAEELLEYDRQVAKHINFTALYGAPV